MSDSRAKLSDPPANAFVGSINPAFQQHLFNLSEAEIETAIEPDCVGDNFSWKPMTFVADDGCLHRHQLRPNRGANNCRVVNVTTPY